MKLWISYNKEQDPQLKDYFCVVIINVNDQFPIPQNFNEMIYYRHTAVRVCSEFTG